MGSEPDYSSFCMKAIDADTAFVKLTFAEVILAVNANILDVTFILQPRSGMISRRDKEKKVRRFVFRGESDYLEFTVSTVNNKAVRSELGLGAFDMLLLDRAVEGMTRGLVGWTN